MTDQDRKTEEVLEQLRRGSHGRDSIALLAVKLIELRNPDASAQCTSESEIKIISPTGESHSMFLQNLWSECEKSPEEQAEIVDRYVRVLGSLGSERSEVSTKNVTVLVRDIEYYNLVVKEDRDLVTDHILGDLWAILGVDLPESIETLSTKRFTSLGFEKKELFKLAIENVERMLGQMEFSPYGECFTLGCEAIDYASTTLLLNYVWEQAEHLIDGDLIVAVPARDTVLFTGSANAKGLQEIREAAKSVVTTGHHVITETLLKRVDREWKLFS
jgi:uncharacterized protein YtpQ (UPF0354 family)